MSRRRPGKMGGRLSPRVWFCIPVSVRNAAEYMSQAEPRAQLPVLMRKTCSGWGRPAPAKTGAAFSLYTQNHLHAKAENDDQVNPYYDPQGAMDYMLETYFEAVGYITGKTQEYAHMFEEQMEAEMNEE